MATALKLPVPDPAAQEVEAWVQASRRKSLLRFITCGSVDDGKSTLIGRLLHDSKMLLEDQLAALENESRGEGLDFALLVDGLAAEREQGITIDVAYRFFATERRKFIVADTPGHEQYTRNMVTGASTADLAVILIDARKGVLTQTRRHSHIVQLLGIRTIILAVNKMDLVGYDQSRFDEIVAAYRDFATRAGIEDFSAIPVSGLGGDNVSLRSTNLPWYEGPTLIELLEGAPAARGAGAPREAASFSMPVQWVNRPDQDFRGYAGTIAGGEARIGAKVRIEPSGRQSAIARIVAFDGDLPSAASGQAVTLVLADDVDCSRGDLIVAESGAITSGDRLDATIVWMANEAMVPGRAYWLKLGTRTVAASVASVREIRDVETMAAVAGRPLRLNEIGRCDIVLDGPLAALPYRQSRELGGFILIDRASHATVAAGMILAPPARAVRRDTAEAGAGRVISLVGASPEGRMAFAHRARRRLQARGRPTLILDSAALRDGLSSDLGHSAADEAENRRRAAEVARLMSRAGITVLIALDVPDGEEKPGTEIDVSGAGADWDWTI